MNAFPKSARLLSAPQYTAVFKAPEINLSAGPLRIRAIQNRMPGARLGLVVPKKGTPKAARRNRIKRIIREVFRHKASELPSVDLVVQVFRDLEDNQLKILLNEQFTHIEQKLK